MAQRGGRACLSDLMVSAPEAGLLPNILLATPTPSTGLFL